MAIDVNELISPLRYDILVRLRFFERFGGSTNPESILPALLREDYFVWFRELRARRHWPAIVDDPSALRAAFERHVGRELRLFDDFSAQGFDDHQPVTIRSTEHVLPTWSGKRVQRSWFMGDGCHRLALLKLSGCGHLHPGMYRVEACSELAPHDNTAILLPHLRLTSAAYYRFLSMGYGVPESDGKDELIDRVRSTQPDRLDELHGVIAIDEALSGGWVDGSS